MPTSTAAAPARDPYLDNARGILIALVVLGHVVETLGGGVLDSAYLWIYSFHMPAFVAVSGYLTRSWTGTPRQAAGVVTSLLVPYLVLDLLHEAVVTLLDGGRFDITPLRPAFTLWFLLALALWRLATPVLRVMRYPLAFALAVSLLVPLDRALGTTLTLGRVVGFLPFFVLGLVCTPGTLARLRDATRTWRALAVAYLVALGAFCLVVEGRVRGSLLFLRGSYADLDQTALDGIVTRAGVLLGGFLGLLAVLLLTPRGSSWLTRWGRNSLAVYVLHALMLRPFLGDERLGGLSGPVWLAVAVAVALVLTAVLSLEVVRRGVDALLRPRWFVRLLVDERAAERRTAPRGGAPAAHDAPAAGVAPTADGTGR